MNTFQRLYREQRYGPVVSTARFPSNAGECFHVAGPVVGTNRPILQKHCIHHLVDAILISNFGTIEEPYSPPNLPRDTGDFIKSTLRLRDEYIAGHIWFHEVTPINSTLFLLPLEPRKIEDLSRRIEDLEEVTIRGRNESIALFNPVINQYPFGVEYIRHLVFWKLPLFDYSDYVSIAITEHERKTRAGLKKTFLVDREWSRANQGMNGLYRPVSGGKETVVIQGYQR